MIIMLIMMISDCDSSDFDFDCTFQEDENHHLMNRMKMATGVYYCLNYLNLNDNLMKYL